MCALCVHMLREGVQNLSENTRILRTQAYNTDDVLDGEDGCM